MEPNYPTSVQRGVVPNGPTLLPKTTLKSWGVGGEGRNENQLLKGAEKTPEAENERSLHLKGGNSTEWLSYFFSYKHGQLRPCREAKVW